MSEIILANATGQELRSIMFRTYDFEVGDNENSFLITCARSEWQTVPDNARIYIPGTEYGGIYKRLETDTKNGTVGIGGLTWRGMLQKRILCPPSGSDYATDSGELNAIIGAHVAAAFPDLFVGSNESTGVTATFQYERYCTLYDGLKAMLQSVNYKMQLSYDQTLCKVVVEAVPIDDYSAIIEYSSDMNADYSMILDKTGINHLICLGQGELRNRVVVDLYVDGNGVISQSQTFFDEDEIAVVYDYAGAEQDNLVQSGTQQLQNNNRSLNQFSISLDSERDVAIGDIVGSRDYITGMTMTAPITSKIVTWKNGFENTEYKLSNDVTVEQAAQALTLAVAPEETET